MSISVNAFNLRLLLKLNGLFFLTILLIKPLFALLFDLFILCGFRFRVLEAEAAALIVCDEALLDGNLGLYCDSLMVVLQSWRTHGVLPYIILKFRQCLSDCARNTVNPLWDELLGHAAHACLAAAAGLVLLRPLSFALEASAFFHVVLLAVPGNTVGVRFGQLFCQYTLYLVCWGFLIDELGRVFHKFFRRYYCRYETELEVVLCLGFLDLVSTPQVAHPLDLFRPRPVDSSRNPSSLLPNQQMLPLPAGASALIDALISADVVVFFPNFLPLMPPHQMTGLFALLLSLKVGGRAPQLPAGALVSCHWPCSVSVLLELVHIWIAIWIGCSWFA